MNKDQTISDHHHGAKVVEPMAALARFAFDWADALCDPAHGCVDYHRMWSMVRYLEMGGALPEGEDFFDAELPTVARDGAARVILSGGADTGVMTLAVNACFRSGITPEIVMIDRCSTPLQQCRLFAAQIGADFQGIQATVDRLDVPPADAVLAHSFMPFFPHEARLGLFEAWSRNLRIGGKVLMSQRLLPPGKQYERKFLPNEFNERRDRLAAAYERLGPLKVGLDDLLDAADRLWQHKLSGRGVTEAEIAGLCDQTGMEIESIVYDDCQTSTSPTAPKLAAASRKRAGIVLTKIA